MIEPSISAVGVQAALRAAVCRECAETCQPAWLHAKLGRMLLRILRVNLRAGMDGRLHILMNPQI